ncbi:FAD-dependent oxidoreductase [Pseudonocardia endophytica]|uniref:NAD(P)H-dependent nitrite reductase large subunit n=1 Tax=Pseudonocardia endophytica TaxID=401976 RepID=A0A4R1HSH5_PSEEN|nr:FAD-dependent oxidoreductase [Pseudonocardia endophytica]TCK25597.1 NAD(P)H-dependent nitrite reductase large subunit [Pseudonocardia endophytica]
MTRKDLVVIGNGMAGARALEEIIARPGAERFRITVFGDEPGGSYNRILLSRVLAEGPDEIDDIYLNPVDWYAEHDVTLYPGVRVVRIDRPGRKVFADDGTVVGYDTLIIATGSRSAFPPIDGMWSDDATLTPGVFGFRTIDDTAAMLDHARDVPNAVVIGGGLLGLEAAHGLQQHGVDVHVVQSGPVLMSRQLDAEAGAILRRVLERDHGMHVHTGHRPVAIRSAGSVTAVLLADGTVIDTGMVVVAAGTRPNVGLGVAAGLTVERGIVVDDRMRSVDDPDVYVVGECAQHRGEVYGLVAPLWEQAAVLADVLTGADPDAEYHGSRTATKLKVAGVDVASMGVRAPEGEDDEVVRYSEPKRGIHKSVVLRDGRLVGATLLGDTSKVAYLQQVLDRGLPLPEDRAELLFTLSGAAPAEDVSEMDGSTQVCNCSGVSKEEIVACVEGGETSVPGVVAATRAGTGCGTCRGLVERIVTWAAESAPCCAACGHPAG